MRDISFCVDMAQMYGSKDDSALPDRFFCSAPASRCNSWKNKRSGSTRRDKKREHNVMARSNSASLPDCSDSNGRMKDSLSKQKCHLCMVRSFKTTSKGIVDSGSFSKSFSSNSLLSSGSLNTSHGSGDFFSRSFSIEKHRDNSLDSSDESDRYQNFMPFYFRTLVLGAPGVGKTSLIQQLTKCDPSNDDEEPRFIEETGAMVSVQLDGQESTMEFITGSHLVDLECYKADAYILMYSVTEPESFSHAAMLLNYLRQDLGTDRTIFMVANKCDLVRQRVVPTSEARKFAVNNECYFLETSTALSVNMDELLIGILCNIKKQLTPPQDKQQSSHFIASSAERRPRSPKRALSAIGNFLKQACRRDSRRRDVTPILQLV